MLLTFYLLCIGLHVSEEPPQSLPFIPFALVTVIFLHIIVAVVYHTKRNKDPARVHYSTADGDGVDEVMYSTVVHSNTTTTTTTVTHNGRKTEYAIIRVK
ncbi:hypothetical protein MHYP_G00050460 [Metynnis hypsauchen]